MSMNNKKIKQRRFSGTTSAEIRDYELRNRQAARKFAAEGMVLLKNEADVLPLSKEADIALYGPGAVNTIKGGMGSGDVNSRETVSIYQGLKNAGYRITTVDWLENYAEEYKNARLAWRQQIWDKEDSFPEDMRLRLFTAYSTTPFVIPTGAAPAKTETDTAVYVLSRNAGEGKDRLLEGGDYFLSEEEEQNIAEVCALYKKVVLLLNVGGVIDLSFVDRHPEIKSILLVQQPGMEAGNAVADVLSGAVTPSGKLTDTWALDYQDYPSSKTFSHNDGDVDHEEYNEGIYVGYRYFDTFDVNCRYGFGYGLSYTTFAVTFAGIEKQPSAAGGTDFLIRASVKNTGAYAGKEVVQVYVCPPQDRLAKEYRRLVGFAKTDLLAPGEEQELQIRIPCTYLTSFDEQTGEWLMEKGLYGIFVGNSLEDARPAAGVEVDADLVFSETEHICPTENAVEELVHDTAALQKKRAVWMGELPSDTVVKLEKTDICQEHFTYSPAYDDMPQEVRDFVDTLSEEQLILLATGNVGKAQGAAPSKDKQQKGVAIGAAGISVPGSAAETSDCAEKNGLAPIVLADGPAGLRLNQYYNVKEGEILPSPRSMALEGGFLCREEGPTEGDRYYQYCTAFPVGTLLAQSWDEELVKEFGQCVAEEMAEFAVTLWLAPGMNIHRNPLCGRNFEYYSEDPVLSGKIAAATTRGVQSVKGCGTTIKHFACNSQEDNRMGSDSALNERALREIYLKGFEIAVKESDPMSIMTSYNLINGIHAANNYDLCTKVARNEWNYKGVIMTDWTTTMRDDSCTAAGCMRAGNDLVMPGCDNDHDNIRQELADGTLDMADLKRSIARLVNIVWQSDLYEA